MRALNTLFKKLIVITLIIPFVLTGINAIPVTGLNVQLEDLISDPVAYVPVPGQAEAPSSVAESSTDLQKFAEEVINGRQTTLRHFRENMWISVVQQPSGQARCIRAAGSGD